MECISLTQHGGYDANEPSSEGSITVCDTGGCNY